MAITTDTPINFAKAENDEFSWNDSWGDYLLHKASGRNIYQMRWAKTGESVEPEIKAAAKEFWAELETLKAKTGLHSEPPMSDEEYDEYEAFRRRMDDPNSDL